MYRTILLSREQTGYLLYLSFMGLLLWSNASNWGRCFIRPGDSIKDCHFWFIDIIAFYWAVVNGHIKRPQDEDIQSNVLEIVGSNIQSTYITCPADPAATLGIKLPFLVMIVKNLKKYFTFEIQVLDDKNVRRRFRASNFQVCKSEPCLFMIIIFLITILLCIREHFK